MGAVDIWFWLSLGSVVKVAYLREAPLPRSRRGAIQSNKQFRLPCYCKAVNRYLTARIQPEQVMAGAEPGYIGDKTSGRGGDRHGYLPARQVVKAYLAACRSSDLKL